MHKNSHAHILSLHIKKGALCENVFSTLAASAVAFTVVCLPLATPTSATDCDDVKFIFARGSGQTIEDEDYLVYKAAIKAELLRQKSDLKVSYYELGSTSQNGAKYPAVNLDLFTILGAKVSAGSAFSFGDSVEQGILELRNYAESTSALCPHTKYVIAGYSQGAMVITNGLSSLNSDKFIYAATFGDPKLYLPEGKGILPDACLGKNLSPYRIFAPNCRTYAGSLEAKNPYIENGWQNKVGLWCKDNDLVCGAGLKFGTPREYNNLLESIVQSALAAHTRYALDGIYLNATKTIVEKVREAYPNSFQSSKTTTTSSNRDTVILIDDTWSMWDLISRYRKEALHLAKETIDEGGRVALYSYGDLNDHRAIRLADFGASLEEITVALDSITPDLGGDAPESFFSAIADVLNQQEWHVGATKSIIVLTDTSALNPDRDGTTSNAVITRSFEIDPVNIYVITDNPSVAGYFEEYVSATGGCTFTTFDETSTNYLLGRPSVDFSLAEYEGKPGEKFTFTANVSGEITKYQWDLNFDGIFDRETSEPTTTMIYDSDISGYLQLRVTDITGKKSTGTAKVTVSSSEQIPPTLQNLKVTQKGASVFISYDLGENVIGTIISLDNTLLGISDQTSLEITDVTKNATLVLTPISVDGTLGSPLIGKITFDKKGEILTPKTGQK